MMTIAFRCSSVGRQRGCLSRARKTSYRSRYDLVSTRHYPSLDHKLAMSVGGRRDMDELHREHWQALARDAGVGPRVVIEIVGETVELTRQVLSSWTQEFRDHHGRHPILEGLPRAIERRARAVARRLTTATR